MLERRLALAGTLGIGCMPVLFFGFTGAVISFLYFAFAILAAAVILPALLVFLMLRRWLKLSARASGGGVVLTSLTVHMLLQARYPAPDIGQNPYLIVVVMHVPLILILAWLEMQPANRHVR